MSEWKLGFSNKDQRPQDTLSANFQEKRKTLNFSAQICPKMELELEIQKTNVGTSLNFLIQAWPGMDLGLEIRKTNVEIKISIIEIPCVPIFR